MTNDEVRALCLALMNADSEDLVVKVLTEAGLWGDERLWRFYGDNENNFSTIGNQQSRPDAALVEKLVNSEDARLMNACLVGGVDPTGPGAPPTVRTAVAQFFDSEFGSERSLAGLISNWSDSKRTQVARGITVAATGYKPKDGRPCLTISDCGEGQTPRMMPETLLSLNKSNKLRIPFVQGKFNMGGTGVLKFCGKRRLQLILTRRNPALLKGHEPKEDSEWGFTIVRREDPSEGARSSVYTYLAPMGTSFNPRHGQVLTFSAEGMPIFPEGRMPYARSSSWGTLIKLYEYEAAGYSNTHILRKDGLLGRLDILLTDPALPIRLHECRPEFKGHEGSFETTLTGLRVRLEDDKGENLEDGFPSSCPISVDGERMTATIYAFKKGKAETYRKNEGLIFTVNGQTHGHLTRDFYNRKDAGRLNYIADSILTIIDCSEIEGRPREDLFMNSRDRLSHGGFRSGIEERLEEMLRHHQGLRALKEARRNDEIQSKLEDERPLEDILSSLLKQSPSLAALFLKGNRASNPFKTVSVRNMENEYVGKKHPTFFKFKDKEYGKELHRDCHIGQRARITFETDAVNDYFSRESDRGQFILNLIKNNDRTAVADYVGPNLQNGIATLTITLPEGIQHGDVLHFEAIVRDPTRIDDFQNIVTFDVKPEVQPPSSGQTARRKPPASEDGQDRETPIGISLPNIIPVEENDWPQQSPPFDKYTALRLGITEEPSNGGSEEKKDVFDFKINMDNIFLRTELKATHDEVDLVKARWKYGLVLVGLALLHDDQQCQQEDHEDVVGQTIEVRVEAFTRAMGPVLLPMIMSLGSLEIETTIAATASGEAT